MSFHHQTHVVGNDHTQLGRNLQSVPLSHASDDLKHLTPLPSPLSYTSTTSETPASLDELKDMSAASQCDQDAPWQWSDEAFASHQTAIDQEHALSEPFIRIVAETHETTVSVENTSNYPNPTNESPALYEVHLDNVHLPPMDTSTSREFDAYHSDALLYYSRNPVNLVLDSVAPDITPHIVISPPEYEWDEYLVPALNRVDYHYQHPDFLNIPQPARPFTAVDARPSVKDDECIDAVLSTHQASPASEPSSDSASRVRRRKKPSAFSRAQFSELMGLSSWERQEYPDVLQAVHRRLYQLNAYNAANSEAPRWRAMYDDPAWYCAAERPFRWTDPASPLIAQLKSYRGALILDSILPFTAPHIVINAAAPPNPWIRWGNVPNQQDAAWGLALTVPWTPALNSPTSDASDYAPSEPSELSSDTSQGETSEDEVCMMEYYTQTGTKSTKPDAQSCEDSVTVEVLEVASTDSDPDECESRPETPGPGTPLDRPLDMPLALALAERLARKAEYTSDAPPARGIPSGLHRRTASA